MISTTNNLLKKKGKRGLREIGRRYIDDTRDGF